MATHHPFDIPVYGISERYLSMSDLLRAFRSCKIRDPETARAIAEYACDCGNFQAKLAYSALLRTTPNLVMSQEERYSKAEQMLKELLNLLDASDELIAAAASELGALYAECMHRPVGALAMYLHAKRHGATVDDRTLRNLQKKMESTDVNHLGCNYEDSLKLGQEILYANGSHRLAELFLREAVDKSAEAMREGNLSAQSLHGVACLTLGDFYDEHIHESPNYRKERDDMYAAANAHGFPEFISKGGGVTSSK